MSSDTILVFYQEPNYKLDTIIAQNGKFSYTINSDTFTIFSLLLSDKEVLPVFANKGESVTWNGTPGDIQIKGKGDNERMAYILQAIKKTKADSLMFTVDRLIKENPHSFANIYLIEQYYVQDSLPDYSQIDELIQGLSGSIKDTPYMIDLQAKLKEKKELNRQSLHTISCTDKNGKTIGWKEMKDKYILLDFWASWDKASMAAQDSLVNVQKALKKEKFLIVSLSLDLDKKEWLKACDKDTTRWKQVCDFKGWDNSIVKQQGITRLPANLLIAPNKRVVARDIRGKALIDKVKQLIEQDKEKEKAARDAQVASLKVGTVLKGTVETLQNYGAFVKLENGLSGLVHVSQISQKRVKMPSDVLTVGDEVEVKVIGIKDGKISLSMKALEEDKEKAEEKAEKVVIPKAEDIGTNLGDLFKNIQL